MTAKFPTMQIATTAGALRGSDAVAFSNAVRSAPLLSGEFVDVTFSAATTASARHKLGRDYTGAIVVCATAAHGSELVAASPATARAAGITASEKVYMLASTAYTGTVTLWVF